MNVRPSSIILLEENIEEVYDFGFVSDFWDMTPKPQITKAKIDKRDYIKLKQKLLCNKETVNKVKRQHTKWEKIFVGYTYI